MEIQLKRSGIALTNFTKKPDLNWLLININKIINQNFEGDYILIFPFCSPKLSKKKWPYFSELITLINNKYSSKFSVVIAPGPGEIEEAKKFKANIILNNGKSLNIIELVSLINKASFLVSNDTGPAHISAHLNKKGLVLFGSHTTPKKVSIETEKFKAITVDNLKNLNAGKVFDKIKEVLN